MNETLLREAEDRRIRAMIEGDAERLETLLDPELWYCHSDASLDDRASYLEKVRRGHFRYHDIRIDELRVTMLPGLARFVGRMRAEVDLAGRPVRLDNRFLALSRQWPDGWRLLAYQPTPVRAG